MDLTWVIKIEQEPGGSRWRVAIWFVDPPVHPDMYTRDNPLRITFKWEREARDWAELIATAWEMQGQPWTVDPESI